MRWLLAVAWVAGCDPSVFSDLEDSAQIRDLEKPDSYPVDGFGRVVEGFDGTINGAPASRVAITAGAGSPTLVFPTWTDGVLTIDAHLYDVCDDVTECAEGIGVSLSGLGTWLGGLAPDEMCVAIGAQSGNQVTVRCETGSIFVVPAPAGAAGFGASVAGTGLPLEAFATAGAAIVGAPRTDAGAGAVYRMFNTGGAVEVDASAAALAPDSELGATVAAAAVDGDTVLFAAGAPGAGRVLVWELDAGMVTLRACLQDSSARYGEVLAFGDVIGTDGMPDLLVGGPSGRPGRLDVVHLYSGTDLAASTCGGMVPPFTAISCPSGSSVECAGNEFGASVAAGDVNGDGRDDLVVGAPSSTVDGKTEAGAVYVIPGGDAGPSSGDASVLFHSSPESGDRLGTAVSTVRTLLGSAPRAEPVAGAPGRNDALVFLCSGQVGDEPSIGARCIPR